MGRVEEGRPRTLEVAARFGRDALGLSRSSLLWITFFAFVLRVLRGVVWPDSAHPDEIFQVLEPAHRLVYGYGFVPWEFRFEARPWLAPGFVASVLWACKALGWSAPAVYIPVVKVVLSALSMSLPWACRAIARRLGGGFAGDLAFVATAFSYELIYYGSRPLTGVLGAYCLMGSLALSLQEPRRGRSFALGALATLGAAVRMQFAPVAAVVVIGWWWRNGRRFVAPFLVGVLCVGVLVGALDAFSRGLPFVSYYNNVRINVVHGVAGSFGTEPPWWYARALLHTSLGVMLLATIWVLANPRRVGILWPCVLALLVPHTLIGHKEYRFILLITPLVLTGSAILVAHHANRAPLRRPLWVLGTLALCVVNLLGLLHLLPATRHVIAKPRAVNLDAREVDAHLATAPGVAGVLNLAEPWQRSGGYYFLHRDVPLYHQRPPRSAEERAAVERVLPHVSHLLIRSRFAWRPDDFEEVGSFGRLSLLARRDDAAPVRPDPDFSEQLLHRGVDDRFEPPRRFD